MVNGCYVLVHTTRGAVVAVAFAAKIGVSITFGDNVYSSCTSGVATVGGGDGWYREST